MVKTQRELVKGTVRQPASPTRKPLALGSAGRYPVRLTWPEISAGAC